MRSSELALPAGWTPPRPVMWLAIDAVAIVVGLLMALGGSRLVGTVDSAVGAGFGLLGLVMVAAVVVRRRRLRDRGRAPVDTVAGALRIGFSRVALIEGLVAAVIGGASAALLAVGWWDTWVLLLLCGTIAAGTFGWPCGIYGASRWESCPPRGPRPHPSAGEVRVPIHRIDLDEVVLHHLLRFYREHPQARGELAGPAAVARLRDRAFPP